MSKEYYLNYKTLGNASPQGRSRIYFCCHPDDFCKYFESISDEILHIQTNTSIWYYDPQICIPSMSEITPILSQMQLFLIPVTPRFLYTDSQARLEEFAYAIKNNIPILPLVQEGKLENDFNRICGDYQVINKNSIATDPTMIPYETKLRHFLESVLLDDKTIEKIRDAFSAYIFLSYRKKDRAYANSIMSLIHKNSFCRDIAIWYDEYLTPGENFNQSIASAMQKSSLFALLVTPNVLEYVIDEKTGESRPNYVMNTEYPNALRQNKTVLPIEAVATDSGLLKKYYPSISDAIPISNEEYLSTRLKDYLSDYILPPDADCSAEHLFFIGLAYLSGIDVEKNIELAIDLLEQSGEKGLPEAYKKLVYIYINADGVKRDYAKAVLYQEKVVSLHAEKECWAKFIYELVELGDIQHDNGQYASSKDCYVTAYDFFNKKAHKIEACSEQSLTEMMFLTRIGIACENLGDYNSAYEYQKKILSILVSTYEKDRSVDCAIPLSIAYYNYATIRGKCGIYQDTNLLYKKALDILSEIDEKDYTVTYFSVYTTVALQYIQEIKNTDPEQTDFYLNKVHSLAQQFDDQFPSKDSMRCLCKVYYEMSVPDFMERLSSSIPENKFISAQAAIDLGKKIQEEAPNIDDSLQLAWSYSSLGDLYFFSGQLDKAQENYLLCYDIRKELELTMQSPELGKSIYMVLRAISACSNDGNKSERLLEAINKCEEILKMYPQEEIRFDLAELYSIYAHHMLEEQQPKVAKDYYLMSAYTYEELCNVINNISSIATFKAAEAYEALSKIYMSEGQLEIARQYSVEAQKLYMK